MLSVHYFLALPFMVPGVYPLLLADDRVDNVVMTGDQTQLAYDYRDFGCCLVVAAMRLLVGRITLPL